MMRFLLYVAVYFLTSALAHGQTISVANNSQFGTVANALAILTTGGTARVLTTADTTFTGIVISGAGFGGNATIAQSGQRACVFDGPAGGLDYAIISTTIGGDCHDSGSTTNPGGANVVGQITTQNANGTYNVVMVSGGGGGGGSVTTGCGLTGTSTISTAVRDAQSADASYAIPSTDAYVVFTGAFSTTRTATLPAASTVAAGCTIIVKDDGAINGSNTLIVATHSSGDHIDFGVSDVLSLSLIQPGIAVALKSNGVNGWEWTSLTGVQTVSVGAGLQASTAVGYALTISGLNEVNNQTTTYTLLGTDADKLVVFTGSSATTFSTPAPASATTTQFYYVGNSSSNGSTLTLSTVLNGGTFEEPGGSTSNTLSVTSGAWLIFSSDGSNFWYVASGVNAAFLNIAQTFTASQRVTVQTLSLSTTTYTPNFDTGNDFSATFTTACNTAACTFANPSTTPVAGQHGVIYFIQPSSGGSATGIGAWGTDYLFPGGVADITFSTGANDIDVYSYVVESSTQIVLTQAAANVTH